MRPSLKKKDKVIIVLEKSNKQDLNKWTENVYSLPEYVMLDPLTMCGVHKKNKSYNALSKKRLEIFKQ